MQNIYVNFQLFLRILFIYVIFGVGSSDSKQSRTISKPKSSNLFFLQQPEDLLVHRGQDALLNCNVIVNGNIISSLNSDARVLNSDHITWMKNGRTFKFDHRTKLFVNGSLLISSVNHGKKSDEGIYRCKAKYRELTILSGESTINVAVLGRFKHEPTSAVVKAGTVHRFRCEVDDAKPPPIVTWIKDGVEIGSSEMKDSSSTWQSDELLLAAIRRRSVVLPDGSMEINPVLTQDEGSYQCVVKNNVRSRRSSSATLTVEQEKDSNAEPKFLITPDDVIANVGQSVLLNCAATGHPVPQIRWTKDGEGFDIRRETRLALLSKGNLWIKKVQANDGGEYGCHASNGVGETQVASVNLSVHVHPEFSETPRSNYYAEFRSSETLQCNAIGVPEPKVTWYKNGRLLDETSYQISFDRIKHSDAGLYQCFASNSAGTIMAPMELIVVKKERQSFLADDAGTYFESIKTVPSPPLNLRSVNLDDGSVKILWDAPEVGSQQVTRFDLFVSQIDKSRKHVISVSELSHVLTDVTPGEELLVNVTAVNGDIMGAPSNIIHIQVPKLQINPSLIQNLQAVAESSSEIRVSWGPPLNIADKMTVQQYRVIMEYYWDNQLHKEKVDLSELSFLFGGLRPYTPYTFSVTIFYVNKSIGETSEKITTRTLETEPYDAPEGLTATANNWSSIKVKWEHIPSYRVNGNLQGYKIKYKATSSRQTKTIEVPKDQNQEIIKGLQSNEIYSIRIQAYNNVGTGPLSKKIIVRLPKKDAKINAEILDPPGQVRSVKTDVYSNEIVVSWMRPQDDVVSHYMINWGKTNPFENVSNISSTRNSYTIKKLEPSTNYVVLVRALNDAGPGPGNMDLILTKPPEAEDLYPPVQVLTKVIDHQTINVSWYDRTVISDNRIYSVRYKTDLPTSKPKVQFLNTTNLFCTLTNLNPNTKYEISVRVYKGHWRSELSMSSIAKTLETVPTTAPTDITIIPIVNAPTSVEITWQPPEEANGKIIGYFLFYSTIPTDDLSKWIPNPVLGDQLSDVIEGLTLNTKYYFKIQARNEKGYGPHSDMVTYTTIHGPRISKVSEPVGISKLVFYLIIAGGVLFVIMIAAVTILILYRHKRAHRNHKTQSIYKGKASMANDRYSGVGKIPQNGFVASQGTWQHARPAQYTINDQLLYDGYRSSLDNRYQLTDKPIMQEQPNQPYPRVYHEELIRTPANEKMYMEKSHPILTNGSMVHPVDRQYVHMRPSYGSEYGYTPINAQPDITSDSAYGSDYPYHSQVDDLGHLPNDDPRYTRHHDADERQESDSREQLTSRKASQTNGDEGIDSDTISKHSSSTTAATDGRQSRSDRGSLLLYENNC